MGQNTTSSKERFEKQLRLRFDGAMLFMDTFPSIFSLFSDSGFTDAALSIKNRPEDILCVARTRINDRAVVLFASADNFVDSLFALDSQIAAGIWKDDKWEKPGSGTKKAK